MSNELDRLFVRIQRLDRQIRVLKMRKAGKTGRSLKSINNKIKTLNEERDTLVDRIQEIGRQLESRVDFDRRMRRLRIIKPQFNLREVPSRSGLIDIN